MTELQAGDRVRFLAPGWADGTTDVPPLRGTIKKVRVRPPGYEVKVDYIVGRVWFDIDEVERDT